MSRDRRRAARTADDRSAVRLVVIRVLVVSLLATLGGRLWFLQVLARHDFAQAAAANRIRDAVTAAPRGVILDATGRPLVRNRIALVVTVDRTALQREPGGGAAVLRRLAGLTAVPYAELTARIRPCEPGVAPPCWNGSPVQPVPVLEDARPAVALRIAEHQEDYPGVRADFQAVRDYPGHTLAAHALGYVAPISAAQLKDPAYRGARDTDLVGVAGLEQQYDPLLRGADGIRQVAVDHAGRVTGTVSTTAPVPGSNLVTTLNLRLQALAEQALRQGIRRARTGHDRYGRPYRATSGAVVVLDAQTGAVLAIASSPTYDPTVWVGGISTADYRRLVSPSDGIPLFSRATQGEFSPGSTFKLVSAAAAAAGGNSLGGTYDCPGAYRVGTTTFRNFEGEAFGPMDLRTALIKSCDTVFYRFGYEMWLRDGGLHPRPGQAREIFARQAKAFGFAAATGIDLPGEAAGRIPDRAWKKQFWALRKGDYCAGAKNRTFSPEHRRLDAEFCADGFAYRAGDAVNFAIGQGDVLVTPLQLAVAYAALANGGTVYQPWAGRAALAADGTVVWRNRPTALRHLPVARSALDFIRSALAGVTRPGGTAYAAFADWPQDRLPVGGKTGTAEVGLTKTAKQDTSWFAAFVPADKPRFVVVSMLEQVGTGGAYAARVVRQVLDGIYGVGGAPAVFPAGRPSYALPQTRSDGTLGVVPAADTGGYAPARARSP